MNWTEAVVQKFERLRERLAAAEAERDAALAGEARAVEALKAVITAAAELAEECDEGTWTVDETRMHNLHDVLDKYEPMIEENPPAIAWLAQQRREAAAEENDRWANEWWELARPSSLIASDFTTRAAALRAGEAGNE